LAQPGAARGLIELAVRDRRSAGAIAADRKDFEEEAAAISGELHRRDVERRRQALEAELRALPVEVQP
jgi:hypothetical protein